jgi:hypothetical protein
MSLIKPSAGQQESLQAAHDQFEQSQEEARAEQIRREQVGLEQTLRRMLCEKAVKVAGEIALHNLGIGNRMGGDKEKFSDWATLSRDEETQTALQASVHSFTAEDNNMVREVKIESRLRSLQHEFWSKAETLVTFDIAAEQTWLHDNDAKTKTEVQPNADEYSEVVHLLNQLEVAEFDTPGEPLIGV